ncbi:hypothetical protein M8542_36630 [Amycolatopsis sp. OK19-0408]|uniref:Uncharacterized protein n=1 Tax=Amycolatopsis iheyensis TaxID=2945988 RepID=A0A9X2NGH0_9PSEU|nr:hypothetical protein [Amycolatopsis iheyensis]MCR6488371.1 hypothetical protein [Amycolatopsis iheyensis]
MSRPGDLAGDAHSAVSVLEVLAAQEMLLGDSVEDRVRREVGRVLRERILAEFAADRTHAMPVRA